MWEWVAAQPRVAVLRGRSCDLRELRLGVVGVGGLHSQEWLCYGAELRFCEIAGWELWGWVAAQPRVAVLQIQDVESISSTMAEASLDQGQSSGMSGQSWP